MATATEELERRWDEFLEVMRLQLPSASFDTWLRDSRVLGCEGEALVVGVPHASYAEWIEKRLLPGHRRTLDRLFPDVPIHIRSLTPDGNGDGPAPAGGSGAEEPAPGAEEPGEEAGDEAIEADAVTDPVLARFDVSAAGWSKLANYALDFWSRLLGSAAFLTWQAIRHEDIRRNKTEWTPTMSFSVSDLADVAANGNPQLISGVWRTCRAASMVERGEPCPECAGRGGQLVEPHVCRFWKPGALDRLQAEGVAIVERRGKPPRLTYRVRVFQVLPLLTPAQVAELRPGVQQRHSRWLLKQNLDPAGWERLTVRHLALPPIEETW